MVFPRALKRKFASLRFRLTAWNTVVMVIVILAMLIAVREALRVTLARESRELLRDEATELAGALRSQYPDLELVRLQFARTINTHRPFGWRGRLVDQQGREIWSSEVAERSDRRSGGLSIVVSEVVEIDAEHGFRVELSMPYDVIQRDVRRVTETMFYIGAIALMVAPLGGYLLASRATHPVRQIIRTTRKLNPSNLDERLVVRGTNDELDQISSEINAFLDQIGRYINSQREFVANAAHELRSPLTAIQTGADVALTQQREPEEYAELLETIVEQCSELTTLVNQLLALAETDAPAKRVTGEIVDFAHLVRRSVEIYEPLADEANIQLKMTLPSVAHIRGDPNRLRQVVLNLVDNALKFTGSGGLVSVAVRATDQHVELSVADSGPGIPEAMQDWIFDRFFQVNPARTRDARRGNGLGLSICKSVVEMHGGKIWVDSEAGRGATFTVQLPMA